MTATPFLINVNRADHRINHDVVCKQNSLCAHHYTNDQRDQKESHKVKRATTMYVRALGLLYGKH